MFNSSSAPMGFWVLCALVLPISGAFSAPQKSSDSETALVLKVVSEKYKKLGSWEASFSQETYSIGLGKGTFSLGKFVFQKPDKFRFLIESPEKSEFVSNGKEAWLVNYKDGRDKPAVVKYFKDVNQVEMNRYLLLLKGIDVLNPENEKELKKNFIVKGESSAKDLTLELEPKVPGEVARVTLVVPQKSAVPSKTIIEDALGTKITLTLNDHKKYVAPKDEKFEPTIPKGSKIEEL